MILHKLAAHLFLLLILTASNSYAEVECPDQFKNLVKLFEKHKSKIDAIWKDIPLNSRLEYVRKARDDLRYTLQKWHGHMYPSSVLAGDAAVPLNAYAFARAGTEAGAKEASLLEPLNIDGIKTTLQEKIDAVKNFPKAWADYQDETATWMAQRDYIKKIIKDKKTPKYSIEYEKPVIHTPDAKNPMDFKVEAKKGYMGYIAGLEIERNELNEKIKARLQPKFFGLFHGVASDNMALQHTMNLKELEIYYQELKRQEIESGKPLAQAQTDIMNQIKNLYADSDPTKPFKKELRAPSWAWNRLHWLWLWGETKSVVAKDVPKIQEKIVDSNLFKFAKQLEESGELDKITGADISGSLNLLKRTKVGTYLITAGGLLTASGVKWGPDLWNEVVKLYYGDKLSDYDIIHADDDDKAMQLILSRLEEKFPVQSAKHQLWDASKNNLVDPDAIKWLNGIVSQRLKATNKQAISASELKARQKYVMDKLSTEEKANPANP